MEWEWENLYGSCFHLSSDGGSGSGGGGSAPDVYNSKNKDELDGTNQLEVPICSAEPFIGLKLGKRTYFENSYSKDTNITSSISGIPVSSVSTEKKVKTCQSQSTLISRCQVEGCNLDLSAAKEYHRKHRVCETHSKCPKVIVAGLERRFCQQCSRFHSMSEFDKEKRSCRRRLSNHNARHRKPQQDPTRFNSPTQHSSFYGTESIDGLSSAAGVVHLSHVLNMPTLAHNRLAGSNGATAMIFDQDFKKSLASCVDAVDLRRALSLLSNNSWGSSETYSIACDPPMCSTSPAMVQNVVPPSSPLSSHEYKEDANQQSLNLSIHARTRTTNNRFQEPQIFKPPYGNSFLFHPNT